MTVLSGGLETTDYGQSGWNAVHTANMEILDAKLLGTLLGDSVLGAELVAVPNMVTIEDLTDSTGGTPSNTIVAIVGSGIDGDINDNFSSVTDELAKAKADIIALRGTINTLLEALRQTGGCGILGDNP